MDTQPSLTARDLLTHVIGDIAKALSDRSGEPAGRDRRSLAAVHTIMAFQPRDAIEAMLAGHCVMFHELIVDSVHDTLRGEEEAPRRATRSGIVAMDKAFGDNLSRLERYQTRQAEPSPQAQPALARAETGIDDRVRRHQSQSPVRQSNAAPPASPVVAQRTFPDGSAGSDPEALDLADPRHSADATGADLGTPATGQMSGFSEHEDEDSASSERSAYAANRQARRHPS
jgi:hypothetical protein